MLIVFILNSCLLFSLVSIRLEKLFLLFFDVVAGILGPVVLAEESLDGVKGGPADGGPDDEEEDAGSVIGGQVTVNLVQLGCAGSGGGEEGGAGARDADGGLRVTRRRERDESARDSGPGARGLGAREIFSRCFSHLVGLHDRSPSRDHAWCGGLGGAPGGRSSRDALAGCDLHRSRVSSCAVCGVVRVGSSSAARVRHPMGRSSPTRRSRIRAGLARREIYTARRRTRNLHRSIRVSRVREGS